ncbi:MAG: preprotein translocase subunit SecG [Ignavibacteriae bacterium]|nr:preprotein translocase subunit SecG [Ignavibacteriota bacterium]
MVTIFIILLIIVCILLVVVVLMQASKGGGLSGLVGGSGVSTMFVARRTSDFLSKSTIVLAVIFLLASLLLNIYISKSGKDVESIIQKNSGTQQMPQRTPVTPPTQQTPGEQNNKGNTGDNNQQENKTP